MFEATTEGRGLSKKFLLLLQDKHTFEAQTLIMPFGQPRALRMF